MTLDEALRTVRLMIGDLQGLVHSDTDLKDLLAQGATEVAAVTLCYERRAVFTSFDATSAFIAGRREYTVNAAPGLGGLGIADHLQILSIHLGGEMPLTQITPEGFTAARISGTVSGEPEFWYEYAGRIGFRPSPSSTWLSGYALVVSYAAQAGEWTSGECVLPPAFDDLVLGYCYSKALIREGQWEEGLSMLDSWFEQVQSQTMITERPATQKSGPPMAPTQRRDVRRQRR